MIQLKNISKSYYKNNVINNLNVDIKDGEFLIILGPSGCGKTTLLKMIAGLEEITDGDIIFDDLVVNKMPPKERNISMVFQNYALFPNMNVYHNIAFGLEVRKYKKDQIKAIVNEISKQLKIDHLLSRKPNELSGGEQQRVALARAMVKRPKVYLFDEPLSSLDVNLKEDLRSLIKEIHKETKATFVYVTHDQNEALALADRIILMDKGKIIQDDTPINLYKKPNSLFVAKFVGEPKVNLLPFRNDNISCYVRPDNIKLEGNDEDLICLNGKVISNEFAGNNYVIHAKVNDFDLKIMSDKKIVDEDITIYINKNNLLFFDQSEKSIDVDLDKLTVSSNEICEEGI